MSIKLQIGLDVIGSYRRLAYTPWHAIAEFVDNSTQSYFNNREALDQRFQHDGDTFTVSIVYERENDLLRVYDNAMGMSYDELEHALYVARPPENTTGRSKYGMGLKTAACWMGNLWTLRTKKLGETTEHQVTVDVAEVANGSNDLGYRSVGGKPPFEHYTIVEISRHNRSFHGRTLGKMRQFLSSMYRVDLREGLLNLEWQGSLLQWDNLDSRLLVSKDGSIFKKYFLFEIDGQKVDGWVGILDKGSRADAGFSILHGSRVVKGWPEAWRPTSVYGQLQGSNDLVNQRLVGEINLDVFEVSHTKDDILWLGNQEEQVEEALKNECTDYREFALKRRKYSDDARGPSEIEVQTAIDELKRELLSPEMVDELVLTAVPPQDIVNLEVQRMSDAVVGRVAPTFKVQVGEIAVHLYLSSDLSTNDPYVTNERVDGSSINVIVNWSHPHVGQLKGSEGVLNYLRHCTYDALAEWQAVSKAARLDPQTIKLLKDRLLRVPFEMEEHELKA